MVKEPNIGGQVHESTIFGLTTAHALAAYTMGISERCIMLLQAHIFLFILHCFFVFFWYYFFDFFFFFLFARRL